MLIKVLPFDSAQGAFLRWLSVVVVAERSRSQAYFEVLALRLSIFNQVNLNG